MRLAQKKSDQHSPLERLNPRFAGNGLDGTYASALDEEIRALSVVPAWVHGHTHIARTYRIGGTAVHSNAFGFESKGHAWARLHHRCALPTVTMATMCQDQRKKTYFTSAATTRAMMMSQMRCIQPMPQNAPSYIMECNSYSAPERSE